MNAQQLTTASQLSWIVLCLMMLFSRFVFQAAGAVGMRRFLDGWKASVTHRIWGCLASLWGVVLWIGIASNWSELSWLDALLAISVAGVLLADGLLNLMPGGFANFKERMQDAWVRRQEGSGRESDDHLFGTVNLLLGLASVAVAIAVYAYRPMGAQWIMISVGLSLGLTIALIAGCKYEIRKSA